MSTSDSISPLVAVVNSTSPSAANVPEYWKLFVTLISTSAVFLFLTILIYLVIWEKHNCHGWTQFSYLVALFLFDCVFIPALIPGLTSGRQIKPICFTLAILNQYFFICAKTWLLIISVDLYLIIRKVKIVAKSRGKNLRRFVFYSIVAWTFPLCFVGSGVILNLTHRNILKEKHFDEGLWAKIPDYGFLHCRIPNWLVWECFVFTNCLFHIAMFGLISMQIFCQSHKSTISELSTNSQSCRRSKIRLMVRLFVVVGLSWSYIAAQDLLQAGNINTKQSWGWHVFRCVYFLQGVFISTITLTHGRNMKNVLQKFPQLHCKLALVKSISPELATLQNGIKRLCVWDLTRKESIQSTESNKTVTTIA